MKRLVVVLIITYNTLAAASAEFPICTAPGEQFYPDVCWDGSEFWVVWQDDSLGTIRGIRVNENGQLVGSEVELLNKGSDPGPVRYPCVAAGPDRIAVEARVMAGWNEFATQLWGVMHQEYSFAGEPLLSQPIRIPESYDLENRVSTPIVLFGKEHFFSFYKAGMETPVDIHLASNAAVIDDEKEEAALSWYSSDLALELEPPTACWNGDSFMVLFKSIGFGGHCNVFLLDTLAFAGTGYDSLIGRGNFAPVYGNRTVKYQTLNCSGSHYFWGSETFGESLGFDILDSSGIPLKDSATLVGFGSGIICSYPDAVFGDSNFVCVWENRFTDSTSHLYAIEVDTIGEVAKLGYIVWKSPVDQHPALAYGNGRYLLVWSDNRDGDFNIRGMIFDTLEVFESVEEDDLLPQPLYGIKADPNPFLGRVVFSLPQDIQTDSRVILKVYDNTGSLVKSLVIPRGSRTVVWDGTDNKHHTLGAGVYYVKSEEYNLGSTQIIKL